MIKLKIARPLPNLRSLNIEGQLWFDKVGGNSYHTVRISANGKHLIDIGQTYGYENHYLETALTWLKEWELVHEDIRNVSELRNSLDLYISLNWGLKKELYKDTRKDRINWLDKQIIMEGIKNGDL
jgi:hypothetical protein